MRRHVAPFQQGDRVAARAPAAATASAIRGGLRINGIGTGSHERAAEAEGVRGSAPASRGRSALGAAQLEHAARRLGLFEQRGRRLPLPRTRGSGCTRLATAPGRLITGRLASVANSARALAAAGRRPATAAARPSSTGSAAERVVGSQLAVQVRRGERCAASVATPRAETCTTRRTPASAAPRKSSIGPSACTRSKLWLARGHQDADAVDHRLDLVAAGARPMRPACTGCMKSTVRLCGRRPPSAQQPPPGGLAPAARHQPPGRHSPSRRPPTHGFFSWRSPSSLRSQVTATSRADSRASARSSPRGRQRSRQG